MQAKAFQNIHYSYAILRFQIALILSLLQEMLGPTVLHLSWLLGVCDSTVTEESNIHILHASLHCIDIVCSKYKLVFTLYYLQDAS